MRSPINNTPTIKIALACTILGLLVAGLMRGWIIIQLPVRLTSQQSSASAEQRTCTFWIYKANNWHTEESTCVWPQDTAAALQSLVSSWVELVNEEKITTHPLKLNAALVSDEHVGYLSFEQSPFSSEQSTRARLVLIESLLRTIRENLPQITSVMLLVNHKLLVDRCLDFSKPWPIQGFLSN